MREGTAIAARARAFVGVFAATLASACATTQPASFSYDALRARADSGDLGAQYELGVRHDAGIEVEQDPAEALRWYRAAAERGHAPAQNSLGSLYQEGAAGLAQDVAAARAWYERASAQGYGEATQNLGQLYDLGLGVEEDNARAARLYERAAEQGSSRAMLNLGLLLAREQPGVEVDLIEAYKWLELARFNSRGSRDAKLRTSCRGALEELGPRLTEAQIATAKDRAQSWIAEQLHGDPTP